jgi:hypothetical protein
MEDRSASSVHSKMFWDKKRRAHHFYFERIIIKDFNVLRQDPLHNAVEDSSYLN